MQVNGSLKGRRVLVAEDEAVTALMIEDTLREAGCIFVGPVATVRDALALIESEAIDCAILDIDLADGKVGPVAEALVKRGVRFVLATGYDPGTIDAPYPKAPWIAKAFDLTELLDAVEDLADPSVLRSAVKLQPGDASVGDNADELT